MMARPEECEEERRRGGERRGEAERGAEREGEDGRRRRGAEREAEREGRPRREGGGKRRGGTRRGPKAPVDCLFLIGRNDRGANTHEVISLVKRQDGQNLRLKSLYRSIVI